MKRFKIVEFLAIWRSSLSNKILHRIGCGVGVPLEYFCLSKKSIPSLSSCIFKGFPFSGADYSYETFQNSWISVDLGIFIIQQDPSQDRMWSGGSVPIFSLSKKSIASLSGCIFKAFPFSGADYAYETFEKTVVSLKSVIWLKSMKSADLVRYPISVL